MQTSVAMGEPTTLSAPSVHFVVIEDPTVFQGEMFWKVNQNQDEIYQGQLINLRT